MLDLQLWATQRGQTLARTVDGMMLYEKALRLLATLEEPGDFADFVRSSHVPLCLCQMENQTRGTI
jgi:hypothetical protein